MRMAGTEREIGRGREASVWRYGERALRIPYDAITPYKKAIRDLKEHPNVVRILAIDDTTGVMHLEYLTGRSLAATLQDRKPCPALAVQCICHILRGMEHLHSSDIVHGDLSCHNVMVSPEGLKIIDFYGERPTLGSPVYMAPEVVRLGRVSKSSDVWAAAVVMLMLEGLQPWRHFELQHLLFHLASHPAAIHGPPEGEAADVFLDAVRLVFQEEGARCSLAQVLRCAEDLALRTG
jgi:serine/threonine protein kinase